MPTTGLEKYTRTFLIFDIDDIQQKIADQGWRHRVKSSDSQSCL